MQKIKLVVHEYDEYFRKIFTYNVDSDYDEINEIYTWDDPFRYNYGSSSPIIKTLKKSKLDVLYSDNKLLFLISNELKCHDFINKLREYYINELTNLYNVMNKNISEKLRTIKSLENPNINKI